MLRSLVGSEMCIRDSFEQFFNPWKPLSYIIACNSTSMEGTHCLLYTSDAADDLTRVDLGGGRIFQAEDGIRDAQESRGLGDVYKRQLRTILQSVEALELYHRLQLHQYGRYA